MMPIIVTITGFCGIYIKYENQELGNLTFEYNYKINMKDVEIKNEIDFSSEKSEKDIYYTKILSESETREIAKNIFEKLGANISENDTDIYENTAIYYSDNREYNVWIKYRWGTYSFTDYSKFNYDGKEKIGQKNNASREEIENALKQIGIEIPDNAEFKIDENGGYIFSINMYLQGDNLINGNLRCTYYEDGIIKDIVNNLVEYEKVMRKEIMSQEDAYNQILQGKFQYNEYYLKNIKSITTNNIKLVYLLDSKGYFVPTYAFESKINNQDAEINIKAVK